MRRARSADSSLSDGGGGIEAVDGHLARGRAVERAHDLQQRRLARARRPEDRDELAGRDLEVDAAQRVHVAGVLLRDAAQAQDGRAAATRPRARRRSRPRASRQTAAFATRMPGRRPSPSISTQPLVKSPVVTATVAAPASLDDLDGERPAAARHERGHRDREHVAAAAALEADGDRRLVDRLHRAGELDRELDRRRRGAAVADACSLVAVVPTRAIRPRARSPDGSSTLTRAPLTATDSFVVSSATVTMRRVEVVVMRFVETADPPPEPSSVAPASRPPVGAEAAVAASPRPPEPPPLPDAEGVGGVGSAGVLGEGFGVVVVCGVVVACGVVVVVCGVVVACGVVVVACGVVVPCGALVVCGVVVARGAVEVGVVVAGGGVVACGGLAVACAAAASRSSSGTAPFAAGRYATSRIALALAPAPSSAAGWLDAAATRARPRARADLQLQRRHPPSAGREDDPAELDRARLVEPLVVLPALDGSGRARVPRPVDVHRAARVLAERAQVALERGDVLAGDARREVAVRRARAVQQVHGLAVDGVQAPVRTHDRARAGQPRDRPGHPVDDRAAVGVAERAVLGLDLDEVAALDGGRRGRARRRGAVAVGARPRRDDDHRAGDDDRARPRRERERPRPATRRSGAGAPPPRPRRRRAFRSDSGSKPAS